MGMKTNSNTMEMMTRRPGKKIIILLVFVSVGTVLIYRMLMEFTSENTRGHLIWVNSSTQTFNNTCLKKHFERGIDKLENNMKTLYMLSNSGCSTIYKRFSAMYEVDVFHASQYFSEDFSQKMKKWLGNSSVLLELSKSQTVFIVHDIYMHRTTVFNPLRSKRPVSKLQNSVISYFKNISDTSKLHCDFCKPFNTTAEDVFGRIRGKYSVSASNAFKLARWHSLFIPYEHSIFNIDINIFLDVFNTSLKWFKEVHSIDKNAKYPVFFWDMFPHAGASQIHVHVQGILGEGHYPGEFKEITLAIQSFQLTHNTHYWDAVIQLHETFDLVLKFGNTIVISPLVPRREHELWLLSNEPSSEFFIMLYNIIKMYQDKMEKYCFSLSGALPILGQKVTDPEESLPSVIFIGTRGECTSSVNDISSLELFLFNNVNSDPHKTIMTLKDYVKIFPSNTGKTEEMINLWDTS